jgi:hypothetical protein
MSSDPSKQADREIDIRAFLQKDRERILRAIRKRIVPHLAPSNYYMATGERTLLWFDRASGTESPRSTDLNGFVAKTIVGVSSEGILVREDKRSLTTLRFAELPYEDLMKVSGWVARKLPAPAIERDDAMQAWLADVPPNGANV